MPVATGRLGLMPPLLLGGRQRGRLHPERRGRVQSPGSQSPRRGTAWPGRPGGVEGPSDDTSSIMLRFASGATGLLFCSVATATTFSFTLFGSKGLAEISRPDLSRARFVPMQFSRSVLLLRK